MPSAMQTVPAPHSKSQLVSDFKLPLREFEALCEKSESSFSFPELGDYEVPSKEDHKRLGTVSDRKGRVGKAGDSNSGQKALPASSTGNKRSASAYPPLQELIPTQEKHQQLHLRIPIVPTQLITDLDGFSASNWKEEFPLLSWSDFLNDDILDGDQLHTKEEVSEEDYKPQKEAIRKQHSSGSKGRREKGHGQSSAKEVRSKYSSKHSKSDDHKGERERLSKSLHSDRRQRSTTKESDTDRQSRSRSVVPSKADARTLLGSNPSLEAKASHAERRKSRDLDGSTHSVHVSKDIAQSRRSQLSRSVTHSRKGLDTRAGTHSLYVSTDIGKATKAHHCERRKRSGTKESDTDRQSRSRSAASSEVKRSCSRDKNPGLEVKAIHASRRKSQDLDASTHSVHVSKDIAQSRRSLRSRSVLDGRKSRDMDGSTHTVHVSMDIWKAFPGKDLDGALSKGLPAEGIPKGSLRVHSLGQVKHCPTTSQDAQERHLGRDGKNTSAGRAFEEKSPRVEARDTRYRRTTTPSA
jgi:hypothetical protein